jgi:hypothetical protein
MSKADIQQQIPIPIIRDIRFKQIHVLENYNVLLALSGRNDHIRQYKLSSIRKLIKYVSGTSVEVILNAEKTDKPLVNEVIHEAIYVKRWTGDYIKIPETKDSKYFVIQRTEVSIFMAVLAQRDVILCQWAREPYLKFMKLKAFWLPEQPKFVELLHDGITVTELFVCYSSESNIVSVEDSKVVELYVHKDMREQAGASGKQRWRTFNQIPFSDVKKAEIQASYKPANTIKKLAAVVGHSHSYLALNSARYFLGTYHEMTRILDLSGQPVSGSGVGAWKDGVLWRDCPRTLILRSSEHVVAVEKKFIEVVDWKSAKTLQVLAIDNHATLRHLTSKSNSFLVLAERKKKGCQLFCIKEDIVVTEVKPPHIPIQQELTKVEVLSTTAQGTTSQQHSSPASGYFSVQNDGDASPASVQSNPAGGTSSAAQSQSEQIIMHQIPVYATSQMPGFIPGQPPQYVPLAALPVQYAYGGGTDMKPTGFDAQGQQNQHGNQDDAGN